jgi:hypothetical protein
MDHEAESEVTLQVTSGPALFSRCSQLLVRGLWSRWFPLFAAGAFAVYFFLLTTQGHLSPDYRSYRWSIEPNFFWLQATSMLHGHFGVDPQQFFGECWFVNGECIGYFGIAPSIIRIPFVLLLGGANHGYTPVFMTVAIGLGIWAALDLVRRVLLERRPLGDAAAGNGIWMGLSALLLGPASALVFITLPSSIKSPAPGPPRACASSRTSSGAGLAAGGPVMPYGPWRR